MKRFLRCIHHSANQGYSSRFSLARISIPRRKFPEKKLQRKLPLHLSSTVCSRTKSDVLNRAYELMLETATDCQAEQSRSPVSETFILEIEGSVCSEGRSRVKSKSTSSNLTDLQEEGEQGGLNARSYIDKVLTDILHEPSIQDCLAGRFHTPPATTRVSDQTFQQDATQVVGDSILHVLSTSRQDTSI